MGGHIFIPFYVTNITLLTISGKKNMKKENYILVISLMR